MVAKTSTAQSLCHWDASIRLQSPSASLHPTLSRIMDHKTACMRACTRGGQVTRGSLERPLIIMCNAIRQQLMNLQ